MLILSPSVNWWLKSDLFKTIGACLLILGLLLAWMGRAGKWRKRIGYALLLVAAIGLVLCFATDIFHIGRGRPVFVYNFLDLERFRWEGLSSLDAGRHANSKISSNVFVPGKNRVDDDNMSLSPLCAARQ